MPQTIIIAGSGLSSLLMARWLTRHRPQHKILMVEVSDQIGGQYSSYAYEDAGYFDYAIHLYYQLGNPEIDDLLEGALPEDEWIRLEGNAKDIAGLYYNGRLQTDTPYVDLRNVPAETWTKYAGDLFDTLRKDSPPPSTTYDYLLARFGAAIADEVFCPIFEKMYLRHPRELDILAAKLTTIDRVALFDTPTMHDLMQSAKVRERVAFPDQFALDQRFRTDYHLGLYPKKYGFKRVIDALRDQLEAEGVEVATRTQVTELEVRAGRASAAVLEQEGQSRRVDDLHALVWASGARSLIPLLPGPPPEKSAFDGRPAQYYVNLLLHGEANMDRLYYFYCFDEGFNTFRVSNHANFCEDAAAQRGIPLCVEYWPAEDDLPSEEIEAASVGELEKMGVAGADQVRWCRVEKAPGGGMPLPTLNNVASISAMRDHVLEFKPDNVSLTGAFASGREFFFRDVLTDAFGKLEQI